MLAGDTNPFRVASEERHLAQNSLKSSYVGLLTVVTPCEKRAAKSSFYSILFMLLVMEQNPWHAVQQCNISLQDSLVCFGRYGVRVPLPQYRVCVPMILGAMLPFAPDSVSWGKLAWWGARQRVIQRTPQKKKKSWDQFILPSIGLPGHHSGARLGEVA